MSEPHIIGPSRQQQILEHADAICSYLSGAEAEDFFNWAQENQATLDDAKGHILWHVAALEWSLRPTGHVNPERYFLWCLKEWLQPGWTYELHPSLQPND